MEKTRFRLDVLAFAFPVAPWATIAVFSVYQESFFRWLASVTPSERNGDCGFVDGLCGKWAADAFNPAYARLFYPYVAASALLAAIGISIMCLWWRKSRPFSAADRAVVFALAASYVAFGYAYFSTFSPFFAKDPYSMFF